MKKPINTQDETSRALFSLDMIGRAMARKNPSGAILDQEAQGQRSLVESDTLPTEIVGDQKVLKKAGVKFLGLVKDDPLFQYVQIPSGWKKVPAPDHSMWSYLVDDQGMVRASIFYKAAFYDRRAHLSVQTKLEPMKTGTA